MYATGIGNVVKRDQAKALVYHTFAAFGGDTSASLTLGYRYLMGIGTEQSCQDALYYYKEVADKGELMTLKKKKNKRKKQPHLHIIIHNTFVYYSHAILLRWSSRWPTIATYKSPNLG